MMVSTLTTGRPETTERWLKEVSEAKKELDEARKASLSLDDSVMVDKALGRYVRAVASKGWIFR